MEAKERIDLLQWLIIRSDNRRNSYSSRAALILSADAIILAAIVFLLDKNMSHQNEVLRMLVSVLAFLSLGFMSISLFFALSATTTLKGNSRTSTRFQGPQRHFLNPGETFEELKNYEDFRDKFDEGTFESFIEQGTAELWVALRLQEVRYMMLKKSIKSILFAFGALVIALMVALLR